MNNVMLFFRLFVGMIVGLCTHLHLDVKQLAMNDSCQSKVQQLQEFESSFIYPFSDTEEFTIRHGVDGDYCAFFKSLGTPYYYTAISKKDTQVKKTIAGKEVVVCHKAGEIAAAGCGVLRTISTKSGKSVQAWYICDLKVNPNCQGEHLPLTIVKKVAFKRFIQCPRGFAICMNPTTGDPKAASIFKKHGPVPGIKTDILNIYTLSAQDAHTYYNYLQECFISNGYMRPDMKLGLVSTSGAKDYEIMHKVTGQTRSWHLLHIKPNAAEFNPQEGATHMVCAVQGTQLDDDIKAVLGSPSSTAQILSYGMEDIDFNFLTSDQI